MPATTDNALQQLLTTQEVVRDIVAHLMHADVASVDGAIDGALERLGEHLGVDRTYVFVNHDGMTSNTHEWCAEGISPEIDNLKEVPLEAIAAWLPRLRAGEPVLVDDTDILPPERDDERELLQSQGIRSLLVVPMLTLGALAGFVGFDAVQSLRTFHEGEVNLLRGVADAITAAHAQREAARRPERADQRLRALTRHATDYVLAVDGGETVHASESWRRDINEQDETDWRELVHPSDRPALSAAIDAAARGGPGAIRAVPDTRLRTTRGWRWLAGTVSNLADEPSVHGMVLNLHDITQRKSIEQELAQAAVSDPLTGIGNRALLEDRIARACALAADGGFIVGVVMLDLDRFKLVNDTYGHADGDALLCAVADRLAAVTRRGDTLARFGGDEFVLLIESAESPTEVAARAERIRASLDENVQVRGRPLRVTASLGVACARGSDAVPARLLADADTAMYRAKDAGRDRIAVFDGGMRQEVIRASQLLEHLPAAIDDGRVSVAYQPLVELGSGRLVGVEALARWHDPQLGTVSPGEFIPLAEEAVLLDRMTDKTIQQVLADLAHLPEHLSAAVNLGPGQLENPDRVRDLLRAMDDAGVAPHRLRVEITENSVMRHPDAVARSLMQLAEAGVGSALDDFGTGTSSLSALRGLPVDVVKIDRAFVHQVAADPTDLRLLRSLVAMIKDLGKTPLAEGIETTGELEAVLATGCAVGQGYLLGRPMPLADLQDRLAADAGQLAASAG